MINAGIDIGSVAAKAVLFDTRDSAIIGASVLPTGWNHKQAFEAVLFAAMAEARVTMRDIASLTVTGYGRIALKDRAEVISEIRCHARGAHYFFPQAGCVVDIGGQDSKALRLGPDGSLEDFVMNDKCAAGTGRFIQMVAALLGMDLEEFFLAAREGEPAHISSMCAVFAESEIVSLLARSVSPRDIAAGVTQSVAERTANMARRLSLQGGCVFSGGLGGNAAMVESLRRQLGLEILVPRNPQITGALGAALLAG